MDRVHNTDCLCLSIIADINLVRMPKKGASSGVKCNTCSAQGDDRGARSYKGKVKVILSHHYTTFRE